ncbi:apolipoprotein N-acyltransferase [Chloracidobacterium validum]|uniref:Apolipoprotein N-acyltransferase n=1 Tax=Chloracidobacterium validum TaxID=2821543 RepID=A0ABX8BA92_9BACT|nr:apolipoprotein N-acyltransferase [Chloracidobacterium validum]QUW03332.1 apolipoprotein N-acyltransferase [Chloracidobacterium validum]
MACPASLEVTRIPFLSRLRQTRPWPWWMAAGSALLFVLALPPFRLWPLAFVAFGLLLWTITRAERMTTATLLGWLAGTLFYYGSSWWATHSLIVYGNIPTPVAHGLIIIAAGLVALPTAVFAWGVHLTTRHGTGLGWWCVPAWWCVSEWLRGELFAFGWNPLANAVATEPWLARTAMLGGHYLVGTLVAAFATGVIYALQPRQPFRRAVGALAVGMSAILVPAVVALGFVSRPVETTRLTVIAVQPCAPLMATEAAAYRQAERRQMQLALEGLRQAPPEAPRLVVFPESQIALEADRPGADDQLRPLLEQGAHVLTNATRRVRGGFANAALLYAPDGRVVEYQKTHLMPFGEYIPFHRYVPVTLPTLAMEAVPGTQVSALPMTNDLRLGVSICFESTFPGLHRQLRQQGATLLVNLANDGWFGDTPGSEQHLRHLVYRAIETGCPVVRVTNDGVSALLDSGGQVWDSMPHNQPDVRIWQVSPTLPSTPYVVIGDAVPFVCLAVAVAITLWTLWTRVRFYTEAITDLVAGE